MDNNTEQARSFFERRLHSRHTPRLRLGLRTPQRVTRRICMPLERGCTEVIDGVDSSVVVRCAKGRLWLTHDGDPKDVILEPSQSYQAEREEPLRLHALQPCVLEIEFEDEAVESLQ